MSSHLQCTRCSLEPQSRRQSEECWREPEDGALNNQFCVAAMDAFLLLTIGTLSGFILGRFFSWHAFIVCGPVLPVICAIILQKHGFAWLPGIAVIVGCLCLNQIGYLIGAQFRIKPTCHNPTSAQSDIHHSP